MDEREHVKTRIAAAERDLERGARREIVLAGPPSSGRTTAIVSAIRNRPVIAPGDNDSHSHSHNHGARAANVVVAHYAAVYHAADCAREAGIRDIVCINRPGDFRALAEARGRPGPLLVVCRDTHFARLCDHLHTLRVQRVVFDNIESLRARNYAVLRSEVIWLVCSTGFFSEHRRVKARTHREARMAALEGRIVRVNRGPYRQKRERVFYSEFATAPLLATIEALFTAGRRGLATTCLPCTNVRRADAAPVLGENASTRLADACPICYEDRGPRLVTRCCENNFCAECLVKHLRVSGACPMCRADVKIGDCTSVSDIAIQRMYGIAEESRRLLRACLDSPGDGKVLVVSGRGVERSVWDLLWFAEVDYVDIRGNNVVVAKRLREFAAGTARVGVVLNHEMKGAPLRTPELAHVVFLGHLTPEEKENWASRGSGPHSDRLPDTHSLESLYDDLFGGLDDDALD